MTITLKNSLSTLILAPSVARIIQFCTQGRGWFFTNPSERDKTYTIHDCLNWKSWPNPGGARTDVAPQSAWAKTTWGKDWPPPPVLSAQRRVTFQDKKSVVFETPPDDILQIRLETKVELVPNSTRVEITTKLTNTSNETREWANWLVIQLAAVPNQSKILVPKTQDQQIIPLMGKKPVVTGSSFVHQTTADKRDLSLHTIPYHGTESKLGFSSTRSICFKKQEKDNEFFRLETDFNSNKRYPNNAPIQLYTSGNQKNPYVELEVVGALANLEPQESVVDRFFWSITRQAY